MSGDRPPAGVRERLNDALAGHMPTAGAEVGDLYLDRELLVARLRWPVVIEGQWVDIDRTADLFDLMDMHAAEATEIVP